MTDRPFRDEPTEVLETALGLADTHAQQAARFQPAQPGDELPAVADLFRTELQHREGAMTGNCPNCQHPQHLPGTECDARIDHGPSRFHACLCLARPGAANACPPQMTCQGGTLGYADIWYLQHGHTLSGADGAISPEVLTVGPESAAVPPAPADADLRDRIRRACAEADGFGFEGLEPWDYQTHADKLLAVIPPSAYRRLLARLEADRAGHLRATVRAKEAGADEVLVAVSSTFASAFRHAAAMAVHAFEGPDAAQAYMQRTEGGEEGPTFDAQAGLQRLADDLHRGETAADSPAPGEIYRHYKGGLYAVLAVAEDTGSGAHLVVYHDEQEHHWTRPLAEFASTVADGARRFTLEGEPAGLPAPADRAELKSMFEGLARLLATSSRDWGTYRVDAWLYAVLVGWDCEQTEHDETCVHGAMEETAQRHGWDADTVAKARRYRAAVRRMADEARQPEPWDAPDARPGTTDYTLQQRHEQADRVLDERVAAAKEQSVGLPPQLQAALDVMAKRGRVVELTARRDDPDVVAYRNSDRPGVLLCRDHGDGWMGLTPLTSDDLPDGGLCTECGVDVLIPQQQAGEGR